MNNADRNPSRLTTDGSNDTARHVIEVLTAGWRAQAVYTAVRLDLPDLIEAGRQTSPQLAESTGADRDGLRRLMRLLITMGFFEGNESTGYRNTHLSAALRKGPTSLRDLCLLYGEEFYTAWGHAHEAISTASSGFEIAYGKPLYAYLGEHPETAQRFQRTMNNGSMFFHGVPGAFDFVGKTVVDVGGGGGHLLTCILEATPDARGVLFDREHMMPKAREHLSQAIGLERVTLVAGDMFASVPEGGDVYLLSRVLAGWDNDSVVTAFRNCRHAMKSDRSHLLVLDRFPHDEGGSDLAALWDLHLMVTTGGRHRSMEEITALLAEGGFKVERVAELPMENRAVIATPV